MNQSKKILAALVAVPASVVVADSAFAADVTLNFEINNEFVGGKAVSAEAVKKANLNAALKSAIVTGMKGYKATFDTTLTKVSAAQAQVEVEKVFNDMKANLATGDNTMLYGMFKNVKVKAIETGEGENQKVKLEFTMSYYGTETDVNSALGKVTFETDDDTPLKKIKKVHDYIVSKSAISTSEHSPTKLASGGFGTSHAYAMYTYMLLNKAGVDVRYVYGMKNGVYRSWNIVNLKEGTDTEDVWYNLDVAANDFGAGVDVNYRYFLTNNLGEHRITVGVSSDEKIEIKDVKFNHLATVDNKAVSDKYIYYADKDGKIEKLTKDTLEKLTDKELEDITVGVTSSVGKMIHIKHSATQQSLYFINTRMGQYLYELKITTDANGEPSKYELQLLIQKPIESISATEKTVTYKPVGEKEITTFATSLKDNHNNAIAAVKTALTELKILAAQLGIDPDTGKIKELADAAVQLDDDKKELEKAKGVVKAAEAALGALAEGEDKTIAQTALTNAQKIQTDAQTAVAAQEKIVTNLKTEIKKLEADLKDKTIKTRELYTALTAEQKKEIDNTITIHILTLMENKFFPTDDSASNSDINTTIELLNELDIFKDNYYKNAKDAIRVYDTLNPTAQAAVYNKNLVEVARANVEKVDELNAHFQKLLGSATSPVEKPFETIATLITDLEKLTVRYDMLLPSLQSQIEARYREAMNNAKDSRITVESYRLQLSNTDETTADYLKVIKDVLTAYNAMTISEKALFTAAEVAKITAANSSTESITDLAESLKGDLAEVNLDELITLDLFEKITTLSAQYNSLTPAQKAELNGKASDLIKKLQDFETKFIAVKGKTELKTIEDNIGKIVSNKPKNITDFQTTIVAIQESIKTFESANKLSGSIEKFYSNKQISQTFATYEEAIADKIYNAATTLEKAIKDLKSPTRDAVVKLRADYNEIHPLLKGYISINLLEDKEVSIIKAEIDKLKEDANLAEVTPVYNLYMSISPEAKAKVVKADSERLMALYENAVKNDTSTKEAIKKVQEMVTKLDDKTTREELDALIEAYDTLGKDGKETINNMGYEEKIKGVEERLTAQEEADKDRLAAQNVTTMIAMLNEESTEEILEAREAYDNLTDGAKESISKGTLKLLEYYESRMEELSKLAKDEADVVNDRIKRLDSSYSETQIKSIRTAYNALSTLAKKHVSEESLQKLSKFEEDIIYQNTVVKQAKVDANAFDVYMNDINRNSTTAEIAKARAYYNRLSAEARKHATTYEKLVRLETMWKDPEYLELVFTYYPEYIHEVKPGAIVTQKPTYDPLYIPDDSSVTPSTSPSVATNYPASASWSAYETMRYQNGRYTTTISSTQVKNSADRNMRLKADNIEIVIPTADLKASTATVGVSVNVSNDQLNIQFTEGNNAKYFSDYVEIHVPFSVLKGNASQIIERVSAFGSAASFKVDGSTFIIRTKSSGTFRAATATTYNDIPSGEQGTAIRELAKRGIKFDTTSRLSQSYKQVTKMDVALMIATALDLSSNAKSKYLDLESDLHVTRAQGLLEAGIMSGATSARFNSNGTITKQEAAIIIANMYRYLNQDLAKAYNNLNSSYRDIADLTLEARQSIAILELFGVVNGTGAFEPTKQLTRAEFAELLYKALTAIDYL